MPRPRSLTPAGIAAAALAVIEREGVAGLSMRSVAGELGVGTMSLYRYVEGRDELEGLVIGLILDSVDTGLTPGAPWDEQVTTLVGRVWEAVRAHPAVVPLLLTRRHSSEATRRWGEAVLRALAEGGFTGQERAIAFRALLSYVLGAVQVEHYGPLSGPGTAALARLSPTDYPFLADTAGHARRIPPDVEFHRGLAALLDGLRADNPR